MKVLAAKALLYAIELPLMLCLVVLLILWTAIIFLRDERPISDDVPENPGEHPIQPKHEDKLWFY